MSIKSIPIFEPTQEEKELIGLTIRNHSVFLLAVTNEADRPYAFQIGSGTLLVYKNRYFILTARHVVDSTRFKGAQFLGISISTMEHSMKIDRRFLRIISLPVEGGEPYVPDLSLLEVPRRDVETIKRHKCFFNLERASEDQQSLLMPPHVGFWIACGCPDEMTGEEEEGVHFKFIRNYRQLLYSTRLETVDERLGWDLIKVPISIEHELDSGESMPHGMGGMSGGGLWHIIVSKADDGSLRCQSPYLGGVIIWQDPVSSGTRVVTGHGKGSIYDKLIPFLNTVIRN